jgi:hypothetical protein
MKRFLLFASLILLGCGGGTEPAPQASSNTDTTPEPVVPGTPEPIYTSYEMDPAKHELPKTPAKGKLAGKEFTPTQVELQGDLLTFSEGQNFAPDLELSLQLKLDPATFVTVTSMTVKPSDVESPQVPLVQTHVRPQAADGLPTTMYHPEGYALTLRLEPKSKGVVHGSIVVCLPDEEKSYLAGTFDATVTRSLSAPPTDDDAPFIQGTIAVPADAKGQSLIVGYVGMAGNEPITDRVGSTIPDDPELSGAAQSSSFKPRAATLRYAKNVPNYDFTKLPPGKYFIFARLEGGPATWKWVEVKEKDQLRENLALHDVKLGTVEVKTPDDFTGEVRLVPAALDVPDADFIIAGNIGFALELMGKAEKGMGTIVNVPAGKYTLFATPGTIMPRGTVEVMAGKTAKTELQTEKK